MDARTTTSTLTPLTLAQLRLWLQEQECPGHPVLLIPLTWKLRGVVRADRLAAGFEALTRRHEVLRTGFTELARERPDGPTAEPRQRVAPKAVISLTCIDLQRLTPAARQRQSRRLGLVFSRQPFELAHPPLLRALLLRLEPTEVFLLLSAHHLVVDNGSSGILFEELSTLYGNPSQELPVPPSTYPDFAHEQRQRLTSVEIDRQLDAWQRQLDGIDELALATDRPRPTLLPGVPAVRDGARLHVTMPGHAAGGVLALARAQAVTPFTVLLAGLGLWLSRYCGQAKIPIVSSIVHRHDARLASVVGLFTHPLLILLDVEAALPFSQLVRQAQLAFLDALQADVPVDLLWRRRDEPLLRHPLARVGFTQRPAPARPRAAPPGMAGPEVETGTSRTVAPWQAQTAELTVQAPRFDLETQLWVDGERIEGSAYFDADLFDAATVERLHDAWWRLLARACAAPDCPVSSLDD